jgi:hypothetical protein
MNEPAFEQDLIALRKDLDALRNDYASHRHTDTDSSASFIGTTDVRASTVTLSGGSISGNVNLDSVPLALVDNSSGGPKGPSPLGKRRMFGAGVGVLGRDTTSEQINGSWITGIDTGSLKTLADLESTQLDVIHQPSTDSVGTPKTLSSFVRAFRTPLFKSNAADGTLVQGGQRLVSSQGKFPVSVFKSASLYLFSTQTGAFLASYPVVDNTANTLFISGTFAQTSGQYTYVVLKEAYLGAQESPWRRIFVLGDQTGNDPATVHRTIRMGPGPSSGVNATGVIWMIYGTGNPNGVVVANPGSLFSDTTGTLYFKASGLNTNTGWVALGSGASSKTGQADRGLFSASGAQPIPHGLGRVPSVLQITGFTAAGATQISTTGSYDGATMAFSGLVGSVPSWGFGDIVFLFDGVNGQRATVTVDATNINLSWVLIGVGIGATLHFVWTVQ